MLEKEDKNGYIVRGHYPTIQNGLISYVIIDIKCKTKAEAEEVKKSRIDKYKNLEIIDSSSSEESRR